MTRNDNRLWTCHMVRQEIEAFTDQSLPPELHAAVSEHLGSCEDCQKMVAFMSSVRNMLHVNGDCDIEPPVSVRENVLGHYRQRKVIKAGSFGIGNLDAGMVSRLVNYRLPAFPTVLAIGLAILLLFTTLRQQPIEDRTQAYHPGEIQLADTTMLFDSLTAQNQSGTARSLRNDSLLMQFLRPAEWTD